MSPTLDVIIPTYTIDSELEEMAEECVESYKKYVDKTIIVEDGGRFSPKLLNAADVYIYNKKNEGFTVNVNRGLRYSTADFRAVVSSDTFLMRGDPRLLMQEGYVTSPYVVNQFIERLAGCFFVIPKEIINERGYLLEPMRIYSSDSEYDHRVKDIFKTIREVEIFHRMAQTVTRAGVEGGVQQEIDRKIYKQLIDEGKAAS